MSQRPFIETVQEAIKRLRMVTSGQVVVVAASGGPDSTALLHALWSLRSDLNIGLVAATMDHGIRGAESAGDAEYVSNLCSRLEISCRVGFCDVPAVAKRRRVSTAIAARDERHSFFRQVAREYCAAGEERIALGHTSDDRAETVLMNILRGAGTDGLCAMPAVQLPIIRPILTCSRAQTEAYCTENSLTPRIDSSNVNTDYQRNRVRVELLPYLATYYNSGVRDALVRLAEITHDDAAVLTDLAAGLLRSAAVERFEREIVLDASVIYRAPIAVQRRAVRQAIEAVRGDLTGIGFSTVEVILAVSGGAKATEQTLPRTQNGQVHFNVSNGRIRIWASTRFAHTEAWKMTLPVPGEIDLPFGGRRVLADVLPVLEVLVGGSYGKDVFEKSCTQCHFRSSDIADGITIRSWHPGDRMHPKGLTGTKKLQDLYTDCKVPKSERNYVPVVERGRDSGTILAALGVRCSVFALNRAELEQLAEKQPETPVTVLSLLKTE